MAAHSQGFTEDRLPTPGAFVHPGLNWLQERATLWRTVRVVGFGATRRHGLLTTRMGCDVR